VGVVKVTAENVPVDEVVTAEGDVACPVPSYVIVIVDEAAKPEPDRLTLEPASPVVGLGVMEGVTPVAVNVAEAVIELVSVAVTVLAPAADAGMVKVTPLNAPAPDGVVVTVVPS
jgi:hypothetical protein